MKAHQRGLRNAGAVSRFIVAHDGQRCTACGVCVDICPMDVFAMDDGSVTLDRARCIGCGLCVMNCPEGAVHMAVREDAPRIPRNGKALMRRITFEAIVSKAKDALFGGRRG
jgi:formate hydrogenlyase subunit 6/NADH:ubiquinone oxidoreductase subunit I